MSLYNSVNVPASVPHVPPVCFPGTIRAKLISTERRNNGCSWVFTVFFSLSSLLQEADSLVVNPHLRTLWLAQLSPQHSSVCAHHRNCGKTLKKKRTWSLSRRPYCAGACLIARSAALLGCLFTVLSLPFCVVSLPGVTCPPKSSLTPTTPLSIKAMAKCAEERKQDASRWFPLQSVRCQSILQKKKKKWLSYT